MKEALEALFIYCTFIWAERSLERELFTQGEWGFHQQREKRDGDDSHHLSKTLSVDLMSICLSPSVAMTLWTIIGQPVFTSTLTGE